MHSVAQALEIVLANVQPLPPMRGPLGPESLGLALAEDIERISDEEGMRPRVLLEVNVAGEGSKIGFAPENLRAEMETLLRLGRRQYTGAERGFGPWADSVARDVATEER